MTGPQLNQVPHTIDTNLRAAWCEHLDRKLETAGPPGLVALIEAIEPIDQSVQRAQRELATLRTAREVGPGATPAFEQVDRAADALAASLDRFSGGSSIPADVLAFMQAATSADGVPLALLTEEVRRWLNAQRREGSIRIHWRADLR